MDYWANVDAVEWFSRRVLPLINTHLPEVKFYIVGARPTAAVDRLPLFPALSSPVQCPMCALILPILNWL